MRKAIAPCTNNGCVKRVHHLHIMLRNTKYVKHHVAITQLERLYMEFHVCL